MNTIREIGEAQYQVTSIYNKMLNKSDIIKNCVLEKSKHISNLTVDNSLVYNDNGGSIRSEEVL